MRPAAWCLCLVALVACDKPTGSLIPSQVIRLPVESASLSVTGPDTVVPGATVQYHAMLTTPVGATTDVTQDASWVSLDPPLLTASSSAPGTYTAGSAPGEGNIVAVYQGNQVKVHLYVLNAGTHAVHGTVRDDQVPAPGATVTVTSGIGKGLTANVGSDGRYALYGVQGDVTIAASLAGFDPDERSVDIENNNTTVDLSLSLQGQRVDVSGNWAFAFTASDACTGLPADAKQRTYPLQVTQQDSRVEMSLTLLHSAWQFPGPVRMSATIVNDTLRFTIGEDPVDGPDIYEMLDSGKLFSLGGSGVGQARGGTVDGTLHGELRIYPEIDCVGDHHFHMAR